MSRDVLWYEAWRLVSASYLHIDGRHLTVNIILATAFALTLARLSGARWTLTVFWFSGWVASAGATYLYEGWFLGSSASTFGLIGAICIQLGRLGRPGQRAGLFVGAIAIILAVSGGGHGGAHVLGFLCGLAMSMVKIYFRVYLWRATLTLALLGLFCFVTNIVP